MPTLLTRDKFRQSVFDRDQNKCVFCAAPAQDAHHIMERRLFADGGYYTDNGASVCEKHHRLCESTDITTEQVREASNIKKVILPDHLYDDAVYDKWGNVCLPNGKRLRGELFFDESVQRVIADHLNEFSHIVKYPRTYHLPWSENMNADDRMHISLDQFKDKRVIVTEKMDGENTTMYSDYIHARSVDGRHHVSRNWVKQYWSTVAADIPNEWRICGENLFAEHSIYYTNLDSYFYGFSIWNERNICLNWDDTVEWFKLIGIKPVNVLYDGIYDEKLIRNLSLQMDWDNQEGYVMRLADAFSYLDFKRNVGKYVRKDHIRTVKHWMNGQPLVKNELRRN